jgi:hypothetical protein
MKEEFKKEEYKAFLYKRVDGKTVSHVFTGETACDEAMKDGWVDTPAKVGGLDVPLIIKDEVEKASSEFAEDANVLANYDKIDDIDLLKDAYQNIVGKPMDKRIKNLAGAKKACKKILGKLDGNSN